VEARSDDLARLAERSGFKAIQRERNRGRIACREHHFPSHVDRLPGAGLQEAFDRLPAIHCGGHIAGALHRERDRKVIADGWPDVTESFGNCVTNSWIVASGSSPTSIA